MCDIFIACRKHSRTYTAGGSGRFGFQMDAWLRRSVAHQRMLGGTLGQYLNQIQSLIAFTLLRWNRRRCSWLRTQRYVPPRSSSRPTLSFYFFPKALLHVFQKGGYDYPKNKDARQFIRLITGPGLIWSTGMWKSSMRPFWRNKFEELNPKRLQGRFISVREGSLIPLLRLPGYAHTCPPSNGMPRRWISLFHQHQYRLSSCIDDAGLEGGTFFLSKPWVRYHRQLVALSCDARYHWRKLVISLFNSETERFDDSLIAAFNFNFGAMDNISNPVSSAYKNLL